MDSKSKEIKDILNIILTAVLIICALVIISLLMINFLGTKEHKFKTTRVSDLREILSSYHLPEVIKVKESEDIKKLVEDVRKKPIRAFPLVIEFVSILTIANSKMLFCPIVMNEPQLQGILNFGVIDPLRWDSTNQFSECKVGRRSIWFMPIGSSILYGILIDAQLEYKKAGLGYILVKRIDEITYDVLLQDNQGTILYAARGELKKINKDIGEGTLMPLKDQELVRKIYQPKWDIKPKDFILFSDDSE